MEIVSRSAERVLLLGPLQVLRNRTALALPSSRKVRALLAYLAMAPQPVTRHKLCELFWDAADDPRAELRWCLSKLRPLVDTPTTTRLIAEQGQVRLDIGSLEIDAVFVARSAQTMLASGSTENLQSLRASFRGEFLEGLSLDRAPAFENWLAGQRHRFDQLHRQLLGRLSVVLPAESDGRIEVLRERIELAPLEEAAHIELVRILLRRALYSEAEHQADASIQRFLIEGFDPISLKAAFVAARRSLRESAKIGLVESSLVDAPSATRHCASLDRPSW